MMAGEQEELIKLLKDRAHLVMVRYSALKKEYSRILDENEYLNKQIAECNNDLKALEQKYHSAKMASGVLVSEEDKETARTEINRIVREIDNCIALLNR